MCGGIKIKSYNVYNNREIFFCEHKTFITLKIVEALETI
jgi:hypothetical protein